MSDRQPQIFARVDPVFRAAVKDAAVRHHGGNESLLLREAARLYLAMRRKFGVQYEPIIAGLLGENDPDQKAAA